MGIADALLQMLEDYYGSYDERPAMRRELLGWIQEQNLPGGVAKEFFRFVTRRISSEYRNQPDIVQLETALELFYEDARTRRKPQKQIAAENVLSLEEQQRRWRELRDRFRVHNKMPRVAVAERKQILEQQAEEVMRRDHGQRRNEDPFDD